MKKNSLVYLVILYVVYNLLKYYEDLFAFDVPDDPTRINARIVERQDGLDGVRFVIPIDFHSEHFASPSYVKDVLNQYMSTVLLPEQHILPPYSSGREYYDLSEALYISSVLMRGDNWEIEVLFIDNPVAHQFKVNDMLTTKHSFEI